MNAINGQRALALASKPQSEPEPAPQAAPSEPTAPPRRPTTLEGAEALDRRLAELEEATKFDWNSSEDVFLEEQPRTAAYINTRRQLVIRQEAGPLEEDDTFVFFNRDAIGPLIETLKYWQEKLS